MCVLSIQILRLGADGVYDRLMEVLSLINRIRPSRPDGLAISVLIDGMSWVLRFADLENDTASNRVSPHGYHAILLRH